MDNLCSSGSLGNIIKLPEYDGFKQDVEKLRIELTMLFLERDELQFHQCGNIEMLYILSVGGLEHKVYEIECAILRAKRQIELIQANKNRQEKIVLSKIEEILNAEFSEFKLKINAQVDKINAALDRSNSQRLTDEEIQELKCLYRSIVKSLHPDLHPELSESKNRLFLHAIEAYKQGDLEELRIISEMVKDPLLSEMKSDGLSSLMHEKKRLLIMLQKIKDRIAEIKNEYPYTMKDFVHSPDQIKTRKIELENIIKQRNEVLTIYTEKIVAMLR